LHVFPVHRFAALLTIAALGLALGSCGRRGDPGPPPGATTNHAPSFINEVTSGRLDSHNSADAPAGASDRPDSPVSKKDRTFYLDPLL